MLSDSNKGGMVMYRVLLPNGELTLSTRIEFLKETVNCEKAGIKGIERVVPFDANAIFIHLKMPYTSSQGVLIGNLTTRVIGEIKTGLLRDGYFDFSGLTLHFDESANSDESFYSFMSETDFNDWINGLADFNF